MVLTYEDRAPVFVCDKCGGRNETWKKFYAEYLGLYVAKENWEQPKHHVSCVLGLFCAKYREKYHTDYVFVPSNPNPYSAKEVKDIRTMLATFQNQALEVRRYILWAFQYGLGSNAQITSLAYLNAPGLVRKFKLWDQKRNVLTRSTPLPREFLDWCKDNQPTIFTKHSLETLNDLGAILNYARTYPDDSGIELKVLERATELKLIKDNKLNVGGQSEEAHRQSV